MTFPGLARSPGKIIEELEEIVYECPLVIADALEEVGCMSSGILDHCRQTTMNLCAVFDLTDEGSELSARFTQFFRMPGGHLKFAIVYDEVSNLFLGDG